MVAVIADDRGRIPFALVGVLLLVGAATVASTTGPGDPAADPAVESALDRATATVNAELRGATAEAAEAAASAPVVGPSNTSWGRVVDETTAFRDALRVRVLVEARERLARIERRRGDVRVTASLPPTPNATALEGVLDRVAIERADANGTAVAAVVENATLTVHRGERVVATRTVSPRVTVATPVLAMHDRVAAYERRLNAGIAEPGLTRRLTAQVTAVAWARGWAQNRGAPIENVLANRHVELATNAGALDVQRTTIGHVDPEGLRRVRDAGLAVAGKDVLAATGAAPPVAEAATDRTVAEIRRPGRDPIEVFDPPDGPRPDDDAVVAVDRTADDRYLDYVDDDLAGTVESVYTARARLATAVLDRRGSAPPPPGRPGPGWAVTDARRDRSVSVGDANGVAPSGGPEWERLDAFVREVRIEHTRVRVWERGNETRTTTSSGTERATVAVALLARYDTDTAYWDGPVDGLYVHGAGPLSGPNLADVDQRAREVLLEGRGGLDAVAERAVRGTVDERPVDVTGARPDGLRAWILGDLNGLRERLRNRTVTLDRGDVASFGANPPAELEAHVADRRRPTVAPPARFDGVADRARVAARAAYLQRVRDGLDRRAASRRGRAAAVGDRLGDFGGGDGGALEALQRHVGGDPDSGSRRLPTVSGPDGPVRLRVDAAPSYLTTLAVEEGDVPAVDGPEHPLVARNVNVFTVPHGGVDAAVGEPSPAPVDRSRLDTAARTLRTANDTLVRASSRNLSVERDRLEDVVTLAADTVEWRLVDAIVAAGVANESGARAAVEEGLGRWDATHERALAMANGSAAAPIADAALAGTDVPEHEADRFRLVLDRELRAAVNSTAGRPRTRPVDATVDTTRTVAGAVFDRAVGELDAGAIAANRSFAHLPAGLPLAPIPGSWYATTNVWTVTVRGEYARFGVRTTRAGPTAPGSQVAYVRDGANVTLDLDGDGIGEVLGRSTRVRFEAAAGTAVLVPPGPQGVGDVDGVRNESSAGWPAPGPK